MRTGDAQTQTPSVSDRSMQHEETQTQMPIFTDSSVQHEIHYPSGIYIHSFQWRSMSLSPLQPWWE